MPTRIIRTATTYLITGSLTDEEFEQITRHFVAPAAEEGFMVMRYTEAGPA